MKITIERSPEETRWANLILHFAKSLCDAEVQVLPLSRSDAAHQEEVTQ